MNFRHEALRLGLDPDNKWTGGYVDYEWNHTRHLLEVVIGDRPRRILEFGCHLGASAIVAAKLGHSVTGVDIDKEILGLAALNAAKYGVSDRIEFNSQTIGSRLAYDDETFDAVLCNSVLEYVDPAALQTVLQDIDRVLKPGGILLVTGTSNRVCPVEGHSKLWLVNYVPDVLDRFLFGGRHPQRGLNPFILLRALKHFKNLDLDTQQNFYFEVKKRSGFSAIKLAILRFMSVCFRPFGTTVGLLTPNICVNLGKPRGMNN